MASKLLIVLVLGIAVQSTAAAPEPGVGEWFAEVGDFFGNLFGIQKNVTEDAAETAGKVWQDMVEGAQQDAQQLASWIQDAYNQSAGAWSHVQEQLQAATQKAIVAAQQAMISAGQQISEQASKWVEEASSNLQNAINAISTKTHENLKQAEEFIERVEAALEQLQKQQSEASSEVINDITEVIQQGLQNVKSLVSKAAAEVNNSSEAETSNQ